MKNHDKEDMITFSKAHETALTNEIRSRPIEYVNWAAEDAVGGRLFLEELKEYSKLTDYTEDNTQGCNELVEVAEGLINRVHEFKSKQATIDQEIAGLKQEISDVEGRMEFELDEKKISDLITQKKNIQLKIEIKQAAKNATGFYRALRHELDKLEASEASKAATTAYYKYTEDIDRAITDLKIMTGTLTEALLRMRNEHPYMEYTWRRSAVLSFINRAGR